MAPVADPGLLAQSVASALGVREQPGRPLLDTLTAALSRQHVLLVLDNCEHLMQASAVLVEQLLSSCPRLRILTTTREALRLPCETIWQVMPLSVPDAHAVSSTDDGAGALLRFEAVCLFIERARTALPGFGLRGDNAATYVSQVDAAFRPNIAVGMQRIATAMAK